MFFVHEKSGYMAPEYAMGGLYSIKSDVFSFGVLLLEILSGRRNTSFHITDCALSLVAYVRFSGLNKKWPSQFGFSVQLFNVLIYFLYGDHTGLAVMERRESLGLSWFMFERFMSWSKQVFEIYPNWVIVCSRRCNIKAYHVISCSNAEKWSSESFSTWTTRLYCQQACEPPRNNSS